MNTLTGKLGDRLSRAVVTVTSLSTSWCCPTREKSLAAVQCEVGSGLLYSPPVGIGLDLPTRPVFLWGLPYHQYLNPSCEPELGFFPLVWIRR